MTPLYAFALALIAVAGVLGGRFNRREKWVRVMGAGVLAVGFELVGAALVPYVESSPALTPLMYLHVVIAMLAGLYFLWRSPRLKPAMVRPAAEAV